MKNATVLASFGNCSRKHVRIEPLDIASCACLKLTLCFGTSLDGHTQTRRVPRDLLPSSRAEDPSSPLWEAKPRLVLRCIIAGIASQIAINHICVRYVVRHAKKQ